MLTDKAILRKDMLSKLLQLDGQITAITKMAKLAVADGTKMHCHLQLTDLIKKEACSHGITTDANGDMQPAHASLMGMQGIMTGIRILTIQEVKQMVAEQRQAFELLVEVPETLSMQMLQLVLDYKKNEMTALVSELEKMGVMLKE